MPPQSPGSSPHHAPPEPLRTTPQRLYYEAPTYYRPQPADPPAVFLAGGITGVERWHDHAVEVLRAATRPVVVLNPSRARFSTDDPGAAWEQVSWEQHHLHLPTVVTLFWFPACDPAVTTQPIALFELGQALGERRRIVVGAHPGYPREPDVRMLCQLTRPGTVVHADLDHVLGAALSECGGDR
ncbi:nucleoside 2-deoxyribosyltransferase domain-containing protein [Streptomyces sp. B6B3]|uniref:nucleoside 2-deoxyribosyltransferase domain-containing protein n=1 Tax=Streptomyces sp. B6B3 TaxID=3153570 RepID=UPI00325D5E0C